MEDAGSGQLGDHPDIYLQLLSPENTTRRAQENGETASGDIYARIRHSQYLVFIIMMTGFLLQWPILPTLVMSPLLVWMYVRLAHNKEQKSLHLFGNTYRRYMEAVPGFIPLCSKQGGPPWKV